MKRAALLLMGLVLLAGCESGPPRRMRDPGDAFHPPIEMLQNYDANRDGILTRTELEAGLRADYSAADVNHDGRLDKDETRAVNNLRWSEGLSTTSTLVDWNQDGYVDFNEFAGTARSFFAQLDREDEGKLDLKKLVPRLPKSGDSDEEPGGGAPLRGN
jgi:hypothetical protein